MSEIDNLNNEIGVKVKTHRDAELANADEVSALARDVESKLQESGLQMSFWHHLFFNGGPYEVSDDVCGFYKALSWENFENRGFRLVYSEYIVDFDSDDNTYTDIHVKKPLLESSVAVRNYVKLDGIKELVKKISEEIDWRLSNDSASS